jgi:hypothetical protein
MEVEQPPPGTVRAGAVTKSPVEARQGVKLGTMRWVLGISIVLAIVAMVVAYMVA